MKHLRLAHELHLDVSVGLIFRLRELPLGFRRCPAEVRGIFNGAILLIAVHPRSLPRISYLPRKCLTDFDRSFMMVSSLRKEVVQSNMGICSDCRINSREVADC